MECSGPEINGLHRSCGNNSRHVPQPTIKMQFWVNSTDSTKLSVEVKLCTLSLDIFLWINNAFNHNYPELQLKNSKPFCFHNRKLLVHKNTNHRTPQQGTLFGLKERFQEFRRCTSPRLAFVFYGSVCSCCTTHWTLLSLPCAVHSLGTWYHALYKDPESGRCPRSDAA